MLLDNKINNQMYKYNVSKKNNKEVKNSEIRDIILLNMKSSLTTGP